MDKNQIQKQIRGLLQDIKDTNKFSQNLHQLLQSNIDKKIFANYQRIISHMGKTFGAPLPVLRIIAAEIGKYGQKRPQETINLLKQLWKNGSFEERQIVGKALGEVAKKHPQDCLKVIPGFFQDFDNWANVDNLACFGMEPIVFSLTDKVLSLCEKWVADENKWIRRFGVVTLRAFDKKPPPKRAFQILDLVMEDNKADVKKAVSWILRNISKRYASDVFVYLKRWARANPGRNAQWIIKDGLKKLPDRNQSEILALLN